MGFEIEFDKNACIGCGACASQCEENWKLVENSEGYKAAPIKTKLKEIGKNKEAEEICPVKAIKIKEV